MCDNLRNILKKRQEKIGEINQLNAGLAPVYEDIIVQIAIGRVEFKDLAMTVIEENPQYTPLLKGIQSQPKTTEPTSGPNPPPKISKKSSKRSSRRESSAPKPNVPILAPPPPTSETTQPPESHSETQVSDDEDNIESVNAETVDVDSTDVQTDVDADHDLVALTIEQLKESEKYKTVVATNIKNRNTFIKNYSEMTPEKKIAFRKQYIPTFEAKLKELTPMPNKDGSVKESTEHNTQILLRQANIQYYSECLAPLLKEQREAETN